MWLVPSDFGAALQGFTKMLGAPGSDGVFRYEPSPVDEDLPKPEDDSAEVADWFTTKTDPEIAAAVARAEAEARASSAPRQSARRTRRARRSAPPRNRRRSAGTDRSARPLTLPASHPGLVEAGTPIAPVHKDTSISSGLTSPVMASPRMTTAEVPGNRPAPGRQQAGGRSHRRRSHCVVEHGERQRRDQPQCQHRGAPALP